MLMKLLKIIADKGFYSKSGIAKELNIPEILLDDMVEQLLRMGYIEKVQNNTCSGGCAGCHKTSCSSNQNSNVKFIKITEKGLKHV